MIFISQILGEFAVETRHCCDSVHPGEAELNRTLGLAPGPGINSREKFFVTGNLFESVELNL